MKFTYLGVNFLADGFIRDEVNHRNDEGKKVSSAVGHLWSSRTLSM